MKKITLKIMMLFMTVALSYQGYSQNFVSSIVEGDIYNLLNFGSGDYLKSTGSSTYEFFTVASDNPLPSNEPTFNFSFYHHNTTDPGDDSTLGTADDVVHNYTDDWNIMNGVRGAMRAANTGTVHTTFQWNRWNANGAHKTDKRWVVETVDQGGLTLFRFKALASGDTPRYLYQGIDGVLYNITESDMDDTDNTNTDGQARSTWGVAVTATLSAKSFDTSSIVIANPVNNELRVQGLTDDVNQLTVYNLLGSKVLSKKINSETSLNLNISDLNSGMYIVKLEGPKGAFSKKIIKE